MPNWSTRCCVARAARARSGWRSSTTGRHGTRPRCCTRCPTGWRRCGGNELGPERARALLASVNKPAESALRVNLLRATPEQVKAALTKQSQRGTLGTRMGRRQPGLPELPEMLVLEGAFDAFGSELFKQGALMPQSRAIGRGGAGPGPSGRRARARSLCRAGRQDHASRRAHGRGGGDRRCRGAPGTRRALAETCRQMGADNVRVARMDARAFTDSRPFDRVLVDPPCSGLGTLQARPDLRWQPRRGQIAELATRQAELLRPARGSCGRAARSCIRSARSAGRRRKGSSIVFLQSGRVHLRAPLAAAAEHRWDRRLLHSAATECIGSHVRVEAVDEVRAIMGPECPNCHEPWLRPSSLPGRYRCLYCMSRYELQSVCPNCGEHSTIVRPRECGSQRFLA